MAEVASLVSLTTLRLDVTDRGSGRPIVFLRGDEPPGASEAVIAALSRHGRVIAPWSPGFGRSDLPDAADSIEDAAYAQLDLLERMDIQDAILVGVSFGGWVAAEIAVRNVSRISHMVLAGAFGLRVGAPTERPIADLFALSPEDLLARTYADPEKGRWDVAAASDDDLLAFARGRDAQARIGWDPYMHNPALGRWLHRIERPTLVLWGERDGIVSAELGREYAARIPGADFELVPGAGHLPHVEQPELFARRIAAFAGLA